VKVIPCEQDPRLRGEIERFAEVLKTQAHLLGDHGLDEASFYSTPIFRGAIEKLRGEYSATMRGKREFVKHVLNHMEDHAHIRGWDPSRAGARNDYYIDLNSGRLAVIDLKGCLDGANTTIFERPDDADEFVTWSLCTNVGGDPRRNAWSGIHTRLGAEMIARNKRVDGLVLWDMVCGTLGRPCPKLDKLEPATRLTNLGPFNTPPPCIYILPGTVPTIDHPQAQAQSLDQVELLTAFHNAFGGGPDEVSYVDFEISKRGDEVMRRTIIRRANVVQHASKMMAIRRV